MKQADLFTPRIPYAAGSATSKAAADSMKEHVGRLAEVVLTAVARAGERGLTTDEAEVVTQLSHQSCSARMNELGRNKNIVPTGERRPTRSGRMATVWKAA